MNLPAAYPFSRTSVPQGSAAALWRRPPVLLFAGCSLFLMLVAVAAQDLGRLSLASASVGGIGILFVLDHVMVSVAPNLVLPRIASGVYGLQYAWLTLAAFTGVTVDPAFTLGKLDLADAPLSVALPNLIVPVAACLSAVVVAVTLPQRASDTKQKKVSNIWSETATPPAGVENYLIAAAVVQVAFVAWASAARDLPSYFVRVLHGTLLFVPLFVGRYALVLKRALYVWVAAMGVVFVLGFFSGERFDALVPPVLCMVGYLSACPPRRRAKTALFALVLGVILLGVSGLMARVREQIGRGREADGTLISWDRIDRTLGTAEWVMSSGDDRNTLSAAVWRMVSWPNYAVTRLSPDTVAYAGWSDFPSQVQYTLFNLAFFSGTTVQDKIDMGLSAAPARLYGYSITESNSYEWGLVADGWHRAGIWGTFLFGFAITLMLAVGERSFEFWKRVAPVIPLFLFILWIGVAITVVTAPFLNECRTLFYNTPFLLALVLGTELFRGIVTPVRESLRPKYAIRSFGHREKADR